MGAATVMMATGEDLPANVKIAIEDCGYTSVWDEFEMQLKILYNFFLISSPPYPMSPGMGNHPSRTITNSA